VQADNSGYRCSRVIRVRHRGGLRYIRFTQLCQFLPVVVAQIHCRQYDFGSSWSLCAIQPSGNSGDGVLAWTSTRYKAVIIADKLVFFRLIERQMISLSRHTENSQVLDREEKRRAHRPCSIHGICSSVVIGCICYHFSRSSLEIVRLRRPIVCCILPAEQPAISARRITI